MSKIILASASPRRSELLSLMGYNFEVRVEAVDESIDKNLPITDEIKRLAIKKANAINVNKDEIVIAADTVVVIGNEVLGKPKTAENAYKMLEKLNNKTHEVITAVAIIKDDKVETIVDISKITFKNVDKDDLAEYANSEEPLDKAGAYAIQGKAGLFIDSISGDYYSIMGLPISKVHTIIKKLI